MSKAKFDATRELIQEEHYDAARAVLKTIGTSTSEKWLRRLDEIDPPYPIPPPKPYINHQQAYHQPQESHLPVSPEQDAYYRRENRRARWRAFGSGLHMVVIGLFCLAFWLILSGLLTGRVIGNPVSGTNAILLIVSVGAILFGLSRMLKRDV